MRCQRCEAIFTPSDFRVRKYCPRCQSIASRERRVAWQKAKYHNNAAFRAAQVARSKAYRAWKPNGEAP